MIRIGLIGLGEMGQAHLLCLKSFPDVKIVALCDRDPNHLKIASGLLLESCKTFSNYQDLLEQKEVDAVFISLPNYLHFEAAFQALKAKKHLFLEKPLAHTLELGAKLHNLAKNCGTVFHVGHEYRFSPFFQELVAWIDQGVIGRPLLLWCHEFRQPFPQRDWFYDQSKSGGTFAEKNCHHTDLFNWMTHDQASHVCAFADLAVLKPGKKIACSYCVDPPKKLTFNNTIDHGWAMIEYKKGAKANLGLCMFLEHPDRLWRGLELGLIGDSGKMIISNVEFETMTMYGGEKKEETKKVKNPFQGQWHTGMREEHEAFLQAIRSGDTSNHLIAIAYEALKICLAAEESAKKNKVISVKNPNIFNGLRTILPSKIF